MKNRLKLLLATMCSMVSLFVAHTNAQSNTCITFDAPFDFVVETKKLPAGRYTVDRLNPGDPAVLVIKAVNGSTKRLFRTHRVESQREGDQPAVVFTRYQDNYFLLRVWGMAERNGRELPTSDRERSLSTGRSEVSIVAAKKR